MQKRLDVARVRESLSSLGGIRGCLKAPVVEARTAIQLLSSFRTRAPRQLVGAFFVLSCLPVQVSPEVGSAAEQLKVLSSLNLKPLMVILSKVSTGLSNLDVETAQGAIVDLGGKAREKMTEIILNLERTKRVAKHKGLDVDACVD